MSALPASAERQTKKHGAETTATLFESTRKIESANIVHMLMNWHMHLLGLWVSYVCLLSPQAKRDRLKNDITKFAVALP